MLDAIPPEAGLNNTVSLPDLYLGASIITNQGDGSKRRAIAVRHDEYRMACLVSDRCGC
ncbi:hypothetical protein [Sneathiella sp.]|uniref:hypothetical protein n=1 Tax=Sneathiella sp. TaxID=1964365 RepID=UPI003564941E